MKNAVELEQGDLVKLRESYLGRYTYGIVVQIVRRSRSRGVSYPRDLTLHLYDDQGQLFIEPTYQAKGLMVPQYVDFHVSELDWYRKASDHGQGTTPYLPDGAEE